MVKVRAHWSAGPDSKFDLRGWLGQLLPQLDAAEMSKLIAACECAGESSQAPLLHTDDWSGLANCYNAGLDMLQILAELRLGPESLAAAVLYRAVVEGRLTLVQVEASQGGRVAALIEGVQRMSAISELNIDRDAPVLGQAHAQKENIRKMLIALVDDVRVALIKLAERTCAIRAVKDDPQRRLSVAREVFDVYAPLAHRLGIGQLKWELEDLSFRYLYQDAYHRIAKLLDGKRLERDQFIERVMQDLGATLHDNSIEASLSGRAKHIYSIWRKMQRKGIGFSQVYDIRAVRILVPTVRDCYAALGLVHGLWRNIPNEFDDYIANPKENGYRSLHTAVIGPEGKILEVQIRTQQMDEEAELGVCAHWQYKGAVSEKNMASSYEEKLSWLRQVLDWHEETGDGHDVGEQFTQEIAQDRVYVFTPEGDVVNLAAGATPLDFAYHVHTEIGHSCRGAKVNGSIVPLVYQLKTGEKVQILTGRESNPKRDWLQPGLGFLKTSRARAKVLHWFKAQEREDNVDAGRHLLEREFRRLALTSIDFTRLALRIQHANVEDMFAAVGAGDVSAAQVLNAAQELFVDSLSSDKSAISVHKGGDRRRPPSSAAQVQGVGTLLTHIAGCCKPVPGDPIVGFITQDRGVSVHRRDCGRVLQLELDSPSRIIEVSWGAQSSNCYEVDIAVEAYDRSGLLRDITELLAEARVNVLAVNTNSNRRRHVATMRLTIEVQDLAALGMLLDRIDSLSNVIAAYRLSEGGAEHAG